MSHAALQRVVVRMLHDEAFVRAVYADVEGATRDCDLTPTERTWLLRPDPRAYGVDPLRRSRALTGLIEEYPGACARWVRGHGRAEATTALDAFFSSSAFHSCVQGGASMAESFGTWLRAHAWSRAIEALPALVALEQCIVRSRRRRVFAVAGGPSTTEVQRARLVLTPGVSVHEAPLGLAHWYGRTLAALRAHAGGLVEGVLDPHAVLPPLEVAGEDEGLIVQGHAEEVRLEAASLELARVLGLCSAPIDFDDFVERAAAHGATRDDCIAIATSFGEDGLLLLAART